jgi:hypothetical protein
VDLVDPDSEHCCKPFEKESTETATNSEANSYKFARPRVYVQNSYQSADISALDHLKYISANVGPKEREPLITIIFWTDSYNCLDQRVLIKVKRERRYLSTILISLPTH